MWILMLGIAWNDPEASELARYESERECQMASALIYGMQRRWEQPPRLYGICKKASEPGT